MEIRLNRLPRGTVELSPLGSLGEPGLDELRTLLLDEAPQMGRRVLLDLADVDRVDLAAMTLMMLARIEIETRGGAFVVENACPEVRQAMNDAGLDRFVTVAERRIDSLRALRETALAA